MKMAEKMQTRLDESEKKIELIPTTLQTLIKNAPKGKGEKPCNGEREYDKKKEEKEEKSTPQIDPRADQIKQLLKESSMFNNYFNDYAGFTSIPKGKLSPKLTMPDFKFHGIKVLTIM